MLWWTTRTWENKRYEREKWHLWFAWHPVAIHTRKPEGTKQRVWLQKIYRCGEIIGTWDGYDWKYKYSLTKPEA